MTEGMKFELTPSSTEMDIEIIANELTNALEDLNPKSNEYKSVGENVGWRDTNGSTTVRLESGSDLLRKLLPDSPCNAEFSIKDEQIKVQLSHHDSPTGETHTITAPKAQPA